MHYFDSFSIGDGDKLPVSKTKLLLVKYICTQKERNSLSSQWIIETYKSINFEIHKLGYHIDTKAKNSVRVGKKNKNENVVM